MLPKPTFTYRWPQLTPYPPFSMGWIYPDLFPLYPVEEENIPSPAISSPSSSQKTPIKITIRARNTLDSAST
ncbi:hypothetical protein [Marininema halotolerans]|uniref:Uncharacterized protein n=1 Tax=Marininema halotolerans TaxID=1155944 RepID=A0A1I6S788_9BACL|nr:hypothetical protein [Marininema halotolerans]SFS72796.1 hypothetical protein SAMN05444972_106194 [Marininema halotolerans]